jgi:hypothetical protein
MSEDSDRYPIERSRYFRSVGRLLPHRLGQIFQELGYQTWICPGQSNGVDLIVFNEHDLILVAEVLNFSIRTYLSNERKKSIISNLSEYNDRRLLIYSCLANENILDDFGLYGISLCKIGFQIQPKWFYDYFAERKKIILRRADSEETRQDIKAQITALLRSLPGNGFFRILNNEAVVTSRKEFEEVIYLEL